MDKKRVLMERPIDRSYTLVELLMSLSVIFIVLGLMLPGIFGVNKQVVRTQCANNLRQVSQVLNAWAMSHEYFPEDFNALLEEGYVSNLDAFKCPFRDSIENYEFLAKGKRINNIDAGAAIVYCRHCNMSVYIDTHVEEHK